MNEGSDFMNLVNHLPGMNEMATRIHDPLWSPNSILSHLFDAESPIANDLLMGPYIVSLVGTIAPATGLEYCMVFPSVCAGVVAPEVNKMLDGIDWSLGKKGG